MASGIADHHSKSSNLFEQKVYGYFNLLTGVTTRSALQERLLSAVKEVSNVMYAVES